MNQNLIFELVMAVRAEMEAARALSKTYHTNWCPDGPATDSERVPLRAELERAMGAREEAENKLRRAMP
jgi:hypothetical protein